MRKSKATTKRTSIESREDLESVFGRYAKTVIETAALKAELEESIRKTRAGYEAAFARLDETAAALLADVEAWAAGHPEEFKEKKSLELLHGTIGFRTSTPRVAIPRGTDEEELAATLAGEGLDCYVRLRRELDKPAILAAVADTGDGGDSEAVLAAYGIRVRQSERFFAEVRKETVGSGQ